MDSILNNLCGGTVISFEEETPTKITSNEEYSMWFKEGDDYIPSVNIKTCDKIPSGAYKVTWKRDDYHIVPIPINTDKLYSFENSIISALMDEVQLFWDKKEVYEKNEVAHKRGILLCGAPGTGKTAIITLLVKQIIDKDGLVFIVNSPHDFENLCESLNSTIRKIEKDRPIITIIEDVDQIIEALRGDTQLLDFLDGKTSVNNHLTILTSNDTTDLSEALLRPSRIDMVIEIPEPSDEVRKSYFAKKGVPENVIDEYVSKTEDFSFAELKEVFIGTQILDKSLEDVIDRINEPFKCKNYLSKSSELKTFD